MSAWQAIGLVSFIVATNVMALCIVFRLVAAVFNGIADKHPPVVPLAGAVRKEFQSLGIDWYNLGGCVHMTADEQRWHLEPARLLRAFGARAASVPWSALSDVRPSPSRSGLGTARLGGLGGRGGRGGRRLRAPTWCLSLAAGE